MTDVALDPYTSHGQDGVIDESGYILNDETIAILREAGADSGGSGRGHRGALGHDGRAGGRAQSARWTKRGFIYTRIMAYSAKYASGFYGPFRDAVGSAANLGKGNKFTYQMDPANSNEALVGSRARPGRGRRHGHGQAGHAVSGHRPPGEGGLIARRPSCIR